MKKILLSIIIPFYKEVDLIERAIHSVTTQRLPDGVNIEVLIGNDSQYTENQIRSFLSSESNEITSIYYNNLESGAGNARNIAINNSSGNMFAFLDADDYWCEGKIFNQLSLMKKEVNFVAGAYMYEGTHALVMPPQAINSTIDYLLNTNIGTSTVLIKRDLLGENRFYNYRFSQDSDLWGRLAGGGNFNYAALNSCSAIYCPSTRTSNKFVQSVHFYTMISRFKLSTFQKFRVFVNYSFRGFYNHFLKKNFSKNKGITNE